MIDLAVFPRMGRQRVAQGRLRGSYLCAWRSGKASLLGY